MPLARRTAFRENCVPESRYGPRQNSIQYLSRVTYCGRMALFASTTPSSRNRLRAVGGGRAELLCVHTAGRFPMDSLLQRRLRWPDGPETAGYGAHIAVRGSDWGRGRGGASPAARFVRNLRWGRASLSHACSCHHTKQGGVGTLNIAAHRVSERVRDVGRPRDPGCAGAVSHIR